MELNKILDISDNDKSYSTYLYERIVSSSSDLSAKYRTLLSPDSDRYYSFINPLFSFELETSVGNYLRSFEVISLRDGVWPLLRFFSLNPVPHEIDPTLIIDRSLAPLVPEKWRDKVILRRLFVEKEILPRKRDKILFFISTNRQCSFSGVVKSFLEKAAKNINQNEEIFVYISPLNSMGEESAECEDNGGSQVLMEVVKKFYNHKIHVLDWEEYRNLSLHNFKYCLINPLSFIFTDSYLVHNASQRGAIPLLTFHEEIKDDEIKVNITINHGFYLSSMSNQNSNLSSRAPLPSSVYLEPKGSDLGSVKLSTVEFRDWSYDLAVELFSN